MRDGVARKTLGFEFLEIFSDQEGTMIGVDQIMVRMICDQLLAWAVCFGALSFFASVPF